MKKWLLGILAAIGSILAIILGIGKNKRVKEIKGKIKDNEKKTKAIDKKIAGLKETDEYLKKTLASKKKALKEIEKQRENFGVERKSAAEATSRLRKIGKGKITDIAKCFFFNSF